jgi:hypothetical protein
VGLERLFLGESSSWTRLVNRLGYSLFTVMVVGHSVAGLPEAFMITKTETAENISTGLKQFPDLLDEETPAAHLAVRPSTALIDESTAEQNALGYDAMLIQLHICRTSFDAEYFVQVHISIATTTVTVWFVYREVLEESVQNICAYHVRTAIQQGLQQKTARPG